MKTIFLFSIFMAVVILLNIVRVKIERTTAVMADSDKSLLPKKIMLEGHEYWVSNTNICHSVSCSCCCKER